MGDVMKRIQRKRTKNWKMPENCIYVGRRTRWGNPYKIGEESDPYSHNIVKDNREAVQLFKEHLQHILYIDPSFLEPLRGKDLACWCKLEDFCHADILLEKANS
jgi:hypothetical protein